jgi:hypothetical protein
LSSLLIFDVSQIFYASCNIYFILLIKICFHDNFNIFLSSCAEGNWNKYGRKKWFKTLKDAHELSLSRDQKLWWKILGGPKFVEDSIRTKKIEDIQNG